MPSSSHPQIHTKAANVFVTLPTLQHRQSFAFNSDQLWESQLEKVRKVPFNQLFAEGAKAKDAKEEGLMLQ